MLGQGAGNGWLVYFHSVVTASPHSINSAFFMAPQWKRFSETAEHCIEAQKGHLRRKESGFILALRSMTLHPHMYDTGDLPAMNQRT